MSEKLKKRKKIRCLTLAGGGFYGYAHVGALKELEKYKEYFEINDIRGVSVGSIVATLYAVGYTPDELTQILFDMDFDKLIRDNKFPYFKLLEKYGLYEAKKLEEEIERLIRIKTNIGYCTFSQIKINLTIFSTNLNYQCPRAFNRDNTPRMALSKAVRLSIGYPIIMVPVLFEGDFYGDGGEFMNYPITLSPNGAGYAGSSDSGIITIKNLDETIGITFAAHNEHRNGMLKNRIEINDISDYAKSLGVTMSRAAYVSQVTDEYWKRTIVIHITNDINSMQFNLTKEQKEFIYQCGVDAVREQASEILGIEKIDI